MKVGIPREVKNHEYRVAITPAGVHELVQHGHEVFVETDAAKHEVTRRNVAVTRRGRQQVFIRSQPTDEERREGAQPLEVGERVIVSGGLELFSELINLQAAGDEQSAEGAQ